MCSSHCASWTTASSYDQDTGTYRHIIHKPILLLFCYSQRFPASTHTGIHIDVHLYLGIVGSLLGAEGALWNRELAVGSRAKACTEVARISSVLGASRIVVGHTVMQGGKVVTRSVKCTS